jgi:hypothetical protein
MKGKVTNPFQLELEISESVAKTVLRLLTRIPRTEWRNRIIPFPAIYRKVGYVMKLDRKTTRRVLELLALRGRLDFVRFHGVILRDATVTVRHKQDTRMCCI